jgi:chaperonin GroEL
VDGEALTTFVVNKLRGNFNVLAVKAPGYGDKKKEMLEDIAITVGAKVISEDRGLKLDTAEVDVLGSARRVVSTKDSTLIVGGKGRKQDVEKRIASLHTQREATTSKFDKEKIDERVAKLSGGVAVIRVGAASETEMKYLKLKIEDAVNATKAAISEGIVLGGGSAMAKVSEKIETKFKETKESKTAHQNTQALEYSAGYLAVVEALKEPLRQIVRNSGKEEGVILRDVLSGGPNAGYDALTDEIKEDMFKAGIIDPLKVTRSALEHASSAAAILLTTEVAITEEPEPKHPHKHPGEEMDY